jgi:pimeloyl-ACP methyl ester carboxylesterase
MAEAEVNGVTLYYEVHGTGEPLALVHGSWADATIWEAVAPGLSESFAVLAYDRRGHSRSERPETPGSAAQDADDLAALLEELDLAPAHVVANSFGGNIALRLAAERPSLLRSLSCHEPPLMRLLEEDAEGQALKDEDDAMNRSVARRIADGDDEGAARQFLDAVLGAGAWDEQVPAEDKERFVRNAPTFLDEVQDPDGDDVDLEGLAESDVPLTVTDGPESPPMFLRIVDRLCELVPDARRETIEGADHLPQVTVPERYVESTTRAVRRAVA